MPASVSRIARPSERKATGAAPQLLTAGWNALVGYFDRRAAVAALRELDDRALLDIGLGRNQIEAAVHGLVLPSERGRMS
jgi:uncharacterized protein YjiS (DUF1127 family)